MSIPRSPRTAAPARTGFTLMEILIALSIFGVGLALAASLFPASVSEHEKAIEYTLGTIMCNNGIAQARTQCRHDTGGVSDPTNILGTRLNYPSTKSNSLFQYKITVARVADAANPANTNNYDIKVEVFKGGPDVTTPFNSATVRCPLIPRATP